MATFCKTNSQEIVKIKCVICVGWPDLVNILVRDKHAVLRAQREPLIKTQISNRNKLVEN